MKLYLIKTVQSSFKRNVPVNLWPDLYLGDLSPENEIQKSFLKSIKDAIGEARKHATENEDNDVDDAYYDEGMLTVRFGQIVENQSVKVVLSGRLLDRLQKVTGGTIKLKIYLTDVQLHQAYNSGYYGLRNHQQKSWNLETLEMNLSNPCEGNISFASYSVNNLDAFLNQWSNNQMFKGNVIVEAIAETFYSNVMVKRDFEINKKILIEELSSDVEIVAENGALVKAHKCFLSAHSEVLNTMFKSSLKQGADANKLEMPEMTEKGVKALLAYVYHWETKDAEENVEIALELLKAAHAYLIASLEETMKALLLHVPNEQFTIETAIELFLFSRQLDGGEALNMKSIQVLKTNYEEVQGSKLYSDLFKKDPDASKELCTKILQAWKNDKK